MNRSPMSLKSSRIRIWKRGALTSAAMSVALLAAGCAQPAETPDPAADTGASPYGHVHGMSVDPASGQVLLATHDGLFNVTAEKPEKIGPTIDLMGFSPAGNDHFYASGHPGPGSDLPNPAGLIHSTDGGKTWEPLSRQGESDFHALTVTRNGIVGFDGELRLTGDLETWTTSETGIRPYSLAGTSLSPVVLATTEEGVHRSDDGGETWELPANAPVMLLTTFADEATAVGVAPDGSVQVSRDAGKTWQASGGAVSGQPAAIAAAPGDKGQLQIWVATAAGVERSADSGATFSVLES
ncbi:F510_1955 family glycosylhydrolase [Arthrobacter sp. VKM Ac-2550]|uniref:F510_1955 family glycosylhydrolase n=1 Tax=Crystallibacter permensis TaxID=1938888 RepID=UPI002226E71D|nr:sialidase family protein [Arthrobacter sp. VKM Ac-2550]MCW2134208.1 BNR/Asp-box repeat-containing protein [Arthrobacter sp. VKM Ac-2550]